MAGPPSVQQRSLGGSPSRREPGCDESDALTGQPSRITRSDDSHGRFPPSTEKVRTTGRHARPGLRSHHWAALELDETTTTVETKGVSDKVSNAGTGRPPKGKSKSATQAQAREHARELREAQKKRDRRRRMLLMVGAPVLVVVLIVVGFVIVKANQSPSTATGAAATPAGTSLEQSLSTIPAATFDAVGTGTGVTAPTPVTGPALTADGKPRVLYVGAEFCPYCAAQRWAVVTAMSRFGTFAKLGVTTSSALDIYPSTATLSFHGATYTSSLLAFTGVEQTTNIPKVAGDASSGYTALDTITTADQSLVTQYNPQGSIPFVDFGNKFVTVGASYQPDVLKGLTQTQIAADLHDPNSAVAQQVLGAANMMTAIMCQMTKNQPAAVCTSTAVTSQKLPA